MGEVYDTSWTTQVVRDDDSRLRALFETSNQSLKSEQKQFHSSLQSRRDEELDDLEDKTGGLKEASWKWTRLQQGRGYKTALLISIRYEKSSHKLLLFQPMPRSETFLLLCKASASISRQILSYLSTTYNITLRPLQLSSRAIQQILESYFQAICWTVDSETLPHNAIGTVKIGIAFASPVAPKLKTMELDVPLETTKQLLESVASEKGLFLKELAIHIQNKTGISLPFGKEKNTTTSEKADETVDEPMRISKISCTAFAISSDGRLRFASKVVENASEYSEVVQRANEELLKNLAEIAADQNNT